MARADSAAAALSAAEERVAGLMEAEASLRSRLFEQQSEAESMKPGAMSAAAHMKAVPTAPTW